MTKEKTLADKITFIDNLIDSTFSKKTYLYYRDIIKEIERLKNINEEHRILNGKLRKELQQKENIIKEVREYVNNYFIIGAGSEYLRRLNEILDKGSDKE